MNASEFFTGVFVSSVSLQILKLMGIYVQVEYDIEPCSATDVADHECINTKRISLTMPTGGYVIYGVAHQHSGGIGSALSREVILFHFFFILFEFLSLLSIGMYGMWQFDR